MPRTEVDDLVDFLRAMYAEDTRARVGDGGDLGTYLQAEVVRRAGMSAEERKRSMWPWREEVRRKSRKCIRALISVLPAPNVRLRV